MVPFRMANIVAEFPTLNELFNFVLELEAIGGVMPVILMEVAVPITIAALGIGFQRCGLSKHPLYFSRWKICSLGKLRSV